MSLDFARTVLEIAFLYGTVAMAVAFSFRVLGFPDLTPDGSVLIGAAAAAQLIRGGYPVVVGLAVACLAGATAGLVTATLHNRLGVSRLLAGILVTLALYSISLRVMASANIPLLYLDTFLTDTLRSSNLRSVIGTATFCFGALAALLLLLRTRLGIRLRAAGDSETALEFRRYDRAPHYLIGLAVSNGLAATAGCIISLYQGFTDVSMGTGLVVICLAAVVLGETLLRPERVHWLMLSAVVGMCIYQLVVAVALRSGLTPADLRISTAVLAIIFIGIDRLRTQRGQIGRQIGNRAV